MHKPPRVKYRQAASGYVYEYFFDQAFDAAYRFGYRAGPGRFEAAVVRLNRGELASLAGRALSPVEEYAVAKMALFNAFDERPDPGAMAEPYAPPSAVIRQILAELDLV